MGFWDKVKETAQKAADAAKEQVASEDSLLNKAVEGAKKAADKAVVVAKDQVNRQDSGLNNMRAKVAGASDSVLGKIDAMDVTARDEGTAAAKRYAAKRQAERHGEELADDAPREQKVRFPNSMEWTDDEVYKQVAETIYPDFRSLPQGDKKWALCEIARYDRKIVNLMRGIGSAYIDTVRQLADGDDAYQAALEACGLADDPELKRAFKNWLDDSYDDDFYKDDDGGHVKAVRLLGWLVFQRVGGEAGEPGGAILEQAFADAGVRDVYGMAKQVAQARTLVDARDAVVVAAFKPRRASFASQFLVQRGINADVNFVWVEETKEGGTPDEGGGGQDEGGFSGGSLMEL